MITASRAMVEILDDRLEPHEVGPAIERAAMAVEASMDREDLRRAALHAIAIISILAAVRTPDHPRSDELS